MTIKPNPSRKFKKYACLLILVVLMLPLTARSQGYLRTDGKDIVNEQGEKVILRGMGLGGWMLQEGYMFRLGNVGQQYKIKTKIEELVGSEKTEEFYDKWLANHTRKLDIDSMAAWGFNSIRLPMHYNLYTLPVDQEPVPGQHTWLEKGFTMTDSLLSWCKANNMYLILDLHAAPGGQGNDLAISDRNPDKPSLWESEANQQKVVALWRKLAERYADEPMIGAYDIINEPNWGFQDPKKDFRGTEEKKNEPLRKLMVDITKAIREVDKEHIIIIEGNGFGNNYNGILPPWDDNLVLSFHKYGNYNNTEAIQNFLNLRDKYNLPIWLGESGENSNNWYTEAIKLVEENGAGWAWWQNKKMGINQPLEIKVTPSYQQLLDYWNGKGDKPTTQQAQKALDELAENLKLENNIYHPDVTDAMFRQVNSTETKPFAAHTISGNTTVQAEDFDLGQQRYAYYDTDTASYHFTPGVNTTGNRGRAYRNDGVDIRPNGTGEADGFHVFHIEDGEWLQYTVQVQKAGKYNVQFKVAADTAGGKLMLTIDDTLAQEVVVPVTGGDQNWQTVTVKNKRLTRGNHKLKVKAAKGGFSFDSMQFVK